MLYGSNRFPHIAQIHSVLCFIFNTEISIFKYPIDRNLCEL
jgi:hypothetical protein